MFLFIGGAYSALKGPWSVQSGDRRGTEEDNSGRKSPLSIRGLLLILSQSWRGTVMSGDHLVVRVFVKTEPLSSPNRAPSLSL